MVSILLSVLLAVAAVLSAGVIVATIRQHSRSICHVWHAMRECSDTRDVHYTVTELKVVATACVLRPEFGTSRISLPCAPDRRAAA